MTRAENDDIGALETRAVLVRGASHGRGRTRRADRSARTYARKARAHLRRHRECGWTASCNLSVRSPLPELEGLRNPACFTRARVRTPRRTRPLRWSARAIGACRAHRSGNVD